MTEKSGAMQIDAALVRQLAELLDETRLTEIEVEDGERRIRVARKAAAVQVAAAPAPSAVHAAPSAVEATVTQTLDLSQAVRSPMVGTVYLAAEPGAEPYAGVGDTVTAGQTLVIIEAMKVMNPIAAPRAGRVVQVLVENSAPVEFDQPLVILA